MVADDDDSRVLPIRRFFEFRKERGNVIVGAKDIVADIAEDFRAVIGKDGSRSVRVDGKNRHQERLADFVVGKQAGDVIHKQTVAQPVV